MNTTKTILGTIVTLAFGTVASTARADDSRYDFNGSFGVDDVSMSYDVGADLVSCSASELSVAASGASTQKCFTFFGKQKCFNIPKYPECRVDATDVYARAAAYGTASVSVFGASESIYVTPSVATGDGSSSVNFYASAFGTTLINTSATSIPIGFSPSFGADKGFSVLGVSVDVSAEASAFIGGTLGGGAISDGFKLTMTPTISASLEASAGVSALGASAKIEGDVDLLDLELPSTLSVAYAGGTLRYGINSAFTYSVLSGDMKIKACLFSDCTHKTIASYGGWNGAFTILNASSSFSL